ncbi:MULTISPECIES: hypothetical protein [unclassified Amycolatopsis]|nr:hypothetical protein [Amycolatopsis sp. Poz14]
MDRSAISAAAAELGGIDVVLNVAHLTRTPGERDRARAVRRP